MLGEFILGLYRLGTELLGLEVFVTDTIIISETVTDESSGDTEDTITINESFIGGLAYTGTASENIIIDETIAVSNPSIPETVGDSVVINEQYFSNHPNIQIGVNDTVNITETRISSDPNIQMGFLESFSISESNIVSNPNIPAFFGDFAIEIDEYLESNNPNIPVLVDDGPDSIIIAEIFNVRQPITGISVEETIDIEESFISNDHNILFDVQEDILINEEIVAGGQQTLTIEEEVVVNEDFISNDLNIEITVQEDVIVNEQIVSSDPDIQTSIQESVWIEESYFSNNPSQFEYPVDAINFVEEIIERVSPIDNVTDTVELLEQIEFNNLTFQETIQDKLTVFEQRVYGWNEVVADTVSINESFVNSDPYDAITISETIDTQVGYGVSDKITVFEVFTPGHQSTDTVSDSVDINEFIIDELVDSNLDNIYAPQGTGLPVKPTLTPSTSVTLVFGSHNLTLRSPEFGNVRRRHTSRINRVTRGGKLIIASGNNWPKYDVLNLQFTLLKEDDKDLFLTIYNESLGQDVTYTNHEGRVWEGIILDPTIVENLGDNCSYDLSFELEGQLQ